MRLSRFSLLFPFILMNLFPGKCITASAQSDTTQISFLEMSLEQLLNMEVVSASKISEKSYDAPATIHLINEDQIKTRGYLNLEEVFEDIPEIEIQKKASVEYSNYYTFRGVDGSEKFIIMMDGMRINSHTGTPLAIVYNYPIINVKQIEVILGPASALYGVDAFTGIINIITKKGAESRGFTFNSSFGNFLTTNNSFMMGVGDEDVSFTLGGNYYYSREPYLPEFYPDEYQWYKERFETNGEMQTSPWDNTVISLPAENYETPTNSYAIHTKLNIKDFEVGYFRNYESHSSSISTKPEFSVYCREASFKFIVEAFYSSYNFESDNKKWNLLTLLSHSRDEIDPRSLYINNYTSYNRGYKYGFNRSLKIEEQATYRFSDKSSLIAGFSYENITALAKTGDLPFAFNKDLAADFQNIYYLGTNILDRDGNDLTITQDFYYLQYQNFGTYLQWRTNIDNKLKLILGGRFDYNTRYESTVNPRAGLVYAPSNKLNIKLLYGKAYLAPSPYRTYQHYGSFVPDRDTVTGEVIGLRSDFWRLPGNTLESQKISTYETSISYILNSNLILSLNGFYNDIDDILSSESFSGQDFKGIPVTIVERSINRGIANSYGFTTRINFKRNWQTFTLNSFLAYSFIDGKIDGKQIPLTARNTIKGVIDFNINRVHASTRFLYRSESYHRSMKDASGNRVTSDPYGIINFDLGYEMFDRGDFNTEIFVKVKNLLNSKYYNVPIGGSESFRMVPQDPIRILLGVKMKFLQ
jgi:outer membrane receptor for ferrienterochelin and colicin